MDTRIPRWVSAVMLLLILFVAAGLRLYRLPDLPLGLHYDEAANGILAGEIAAGAKLPIFISSYTGKEVLFFYWAALWIKLLGVTPLALRLSAALVGRALGDGFCRHIFLASHPQPLRVPRRDPAADAGADRRGALARVAAG
jgi:predicted membrane-bound mannosyltransferase